MGRSIRGFRRVSRIAHIFGLDTDVRRRTHHRPGNGAFRGSVSRTNLKYVVPLYPHSMSDPAESAPWTEMEGDDFITKFEQLSLQKGWSKKEAMVYRTRAIDDDIISNYGVDLTNLEEWQKL